MQLKLWFSLPLLTKIIHLLPPTSFRQVHSSSPSLWTPYAHKRETCNVRALIFVTPDNKNHKLHLYFELSWIKLSQKKYFFNFPFFFQSKLDAFSKNYYIWNLCFWLRSVTNQCLQGTQSARILGSASHTRSPYKETTDSSLGSSWYAKFESMSFVVNILACKLKIVNNRNWKKT